MAQNEPNSVKGSHGTNMFQSLGLKFSVLELNLEHRDGQIEENWEENYK